MAETSRVDMKKSWELLASAIFRSTASGQGTTDAAVRGLAFHRYVSASTPMPRFLKPVIIVVAQGRKLVRIGKNEYNYGENICFVTGVNMPVASCVMEASEEKPYLAMSLYLDTELLSALAVKTPSSSGYANDISCGAMIQEMEPDLVDAFLRLAELSNKHDDIPVMGDILLREIHYRLLKSPIGNLLRTFNTLGSQGNQVTKAINWLQKNYKTPLRIEELAERSNMAPSTFHKYFKSITTLSPLQYQKRLRLDEAQRLMMAGQCDVTQAAFSVGYESVTQFIREYKRLFGNPPRRNIIYLKNTSQINKLNII